MHFAGMYVRHDTGNNRQQRWTLERYAHSLGFEVRNIYEDVVYDGECTYQALERMLDDIQGWGVLAEFDTLFVTSATRFYTTYRLNVVEIRQGMKRQTMKLPRLAMTLAERTERLTEVATIFNQADITIIPLYRTELLPDSWGKRKTLTHKDQYTKRSRT